jgi:hypothetical protein
MLKTVAITSTSTNGTVTLINTGTGLTGGPITNTGTIALDNTTVTAGTYGNSSAVSQVVINAQGQVTNAVNVAISIANSAVTGLGTMATQNANAVVITGGSINNTAIGNATANTGVFTTLTNTGTAYLGGAVGNQSLQVNNVASAVNYFQSVGAITAGTPTLSVQGTDANIAATVSTKGSGIFSINANGGPCFQVRGDFANPVTFFTVIGSTGSACTLRASSILASYQVSTGAHSFQSTTAGTTQFYIPHTASAVNYVQATGGATGTAVIVSAQGSDANIDFKLVTKGTGVLSFGTYTAGVLTQTGYITIKDAGGTTRNLLVG